MYFGIISKVQSGIRTCSAVVSACVERKRVSDFQRAKERRRRVRLIISAEYVNALTVKRIFQTSVLYHRTESRSSIWQKTHINIVIIRYSCELFSFANSQNPMCVTGVRLLSLRREYYLGRQKDWKNGLAHKRRLPHKEFCNEHLQMVKNKSYYDGGGLVDPIKGNEYSLNGWQSWHTDQEVE